MVKTLLGIHMQARRPHGLHGPMACMAACMQQAPQAQQRCMPGRPAAMRSLRPAKIAFVRLGAGNRIPLTPAP